MCHCCRDRPALSIVLNDIYTQKLSHTLTRFLKLLTLPCIFSTETRAKLSLDVANAFPTRVVIWWTFSFLFVLLHCRLIRSRVTDLQGLQVWMSCTEVWLMWACRGERSYWKAIILALHLFSLFICHLASYLFAFNFFIQIFFLHTHASVVIHFYAL